MSIRRKLKRNWLQFKYNCRYWWDYNMDPYNSCGYRRKLAEWWHETALRWLMPWLGKARDVINLCQDGNDTKLLDYGANYTSIRTRDENQYYLWVEVDWKGKVTATVTQHFQNGQPINTFLNFIPKLVKAINNPDITEEDLKDDPVIVTTTRTLFEGYVFTEAQFRRAMEALLKCPEFGWDMSMVNFGLMLRKFRPKEGEEYEKFMDVYRNRVMEKVYPGHGPFGPDDWDAYFDAEDKLSAEEMIDMMKGWREDLRGEE